MSELEEHEYKAEMGTIKVYDADKKATEYEVLCETGDTEGSLRLKVWLTKHILEENEKIKGLQDQIDLLLALIEKYHPKGV
jgi:hypothetical protein